MESLRIGNRNVSYRAYGRDVDVQRPPVVLVHGAGGNHLVWPAQVPTSQIRPFMRWICRGMGPRRARRQ